MSEKVKVASIVVVFPGGERREMTLDEAKALHAQNDMANTTDANEPSAASAGSMFGASWLVC